MSGFLGYRNGKGTIWQALNIIPNDYENHDMETTENRSDGTIIGFLTWNSIGVHLPKQRQTNPDGRIVTTEQEGTAFIGFRNKCDEIGYYMYPIQLSKLNVHSSETDYGAS